MFQYNYVNLISVPIAFLFSKYRTIFVFSTRQIQWLARLVDGFHQIQLGFYETEARAIYYGERKRRNPREVDPPDANLRRHSAWLSFKPLNGRKTFLPYCIKAVINSLAIVMHLNEAESWPATFFTSLPYSSHFSRGYANRVNGWNFVEEFKGLRVGLARILMHKIFFVRMNEMEENGEEEGEKKRKWLVKFIAIVILLFHGTVFTNFTRKNLFLCVYTGRYYFMEWRKHAGNMFENYFRGNLKKTCLKKNCSKVM